MDEDRCWVANELARVQARIDEIESGTRNLKSGSELKQHYQSVRDLLKRELDKKVSE